MHEKMADVRKTGGSKNLSKNSENDSIDEEESPTPTRRKDPRIFKIIVIGDSNVGKTCLTYRFCAGKFPSRVEATIGVDFREKTVEIDEDLLKVRMYLRVYLHLLVITHVLVYRAAKLKDNHMCHIFDAILSYLVLY